MSGALIVKQAGPGVTVQDMGRPGHLSLGLSRGGAADRLALLEGAALLGRNAPAAAIELTGMGGSFEVTAPTRIALTGAPMPARAGDRTLAWHASHLLTPGEVLTLGAPKKGTWGYLSLGGGIATEPLMGSRAAHLVVGIGQALTPGTELPLGEDKGGETNRVLDVDDRFTGGAIRLLPSAHTPLFSPQDRDRFCATEFTRDTRGNRQGVRLNHDGDPFATEGQLGLVSEFVVPGDIQMTGEGTPYILLPECQTTGGYPRIGAIHPEDLPRAAQAAPGAKLRFAFVALDEAAAKFRPEPDQLRALRARVRPLTRDPADISDLLSYQLVSGVIAGDEPI